MPIVFYSVTEDHNYRLYPFTESLVVNLRDVLTESRIKEIIGGRTLYCLELASAEDFNLPLYANIGHELGHAILAENLESFQKHLMSNCEPWFTEAVEQITARKLESNVKQRAVNAIKNVFQTTAAEMFCDFIATQIMGPAFYLSLYEVSWGQDKAAVHIKVPTDGAGHIISKLVYAYPSFNLRLSSVAKWASVAGFFSKAEEMTSHLKTDNLRTSIKRLIELSKHDDTSDYCFTSGRNDESAIVPVIVKKNLKEMKIALASAVTSFKFSSASPRPTFSEKCIIEDVVSLLKR